MAYRRRAKAPKNTTKNTSTALFILVGDLDGKGKLEAHSLIPKYY